MRTTVSNKSQACTHSASPSVIRGRRNVFLIECIVKVRSWHIVWLTVLKKGSITQYETCKFKGFKMWESCSLTDLLCVTLGRLCVTEFSYHHNDSLSILVNNFPKSLSAIMLCVMTEDVQNIAHKWVRNDICIINLLLFICGRHKWWHHYVTAQCSIGVTK